MEFLLQNYTGEGKCGRESSKISFPQAHGHSAGFVICDFPPGL